MVVFARRAYTNVHTAHTKLRSLLDTGHNDETDTRRNATRNANESSAVEGSRTWWGRVRDTDTIILHLSTMSNNIGRDHQPGDTPHARADKTVTTVHWQQRVATAPRRTTTRKRLLEVGHRRHRLHTTTTTRHELTNWRESWVGTRDRRGWPVAWCGGAVRRKSLRPTRSSAAECGCRLCSRWSLRFWSVARFRSVEQLVFDALMVLTTRPRPLRLNFAPLRYCTSYGGSRV